MVFYITIYILASLFAFLYSKIWSKNLAFIFKWTSFLILFLPIALRYNIGVDYPSYVWYITSGEYENKFEIGWVIFIKTLLFLNLDLQWFFAIPAFLSLLIVFNFTEKKYCWIAVITYIFVMYNHSFVFVRQDFALCIFLLAIKSFLNQKNIKMFFWIALSFIFHNSTFFLAIALLLCKINFKFLNTRNNLVILLFIFLLQYIHIANIIFNNIIVYTPYSWYENSTLNDTPSLASGLGLIINFFILSIILIFQDNRYKSFDRNYNLNTIFIFILMFSMILKKEIFIFHRLVDAFILVFMTSLISVAKSTKKYNIIALIFVLLILGILNVNKLSKAYIGTENTDEILPYQSIFHK